MLNKERFCFFIEEFFNCKIIDDYYFVNKEGEERIFLLNNGLEFSVKENKKEK